jgi:hypothetical protein
VIDYKIWKGILKIFEFSFFVYKMFTDFRSKGNNEANMPEVFRSAAIPPIYAKVLLSSIFPLKVTTKK